MKKLSSIVVAVFIATWTAKWQSTVGCPIEVSPFTGENSTSFNSTLAIMRYCDKTNDMKKEFDSLDKVREFFRECPEGVCTDIKIEKREILEGEPKL